MPGDSELGKRSAPGVGGGAMAGLLDAVAAAPTAPKKPKAAEKNMGNDPYATLYHRLKQIRQHFRNKWGEYEGSNIEIEAKLGILVSSDTGGRIGPFTPGAGAIELLPNQMQGKKFVSGVSKGDFAAYMAMHHEPRYAATAQKTVTNSYTYGEGKRIQKDDKGRTTMETKSKELEFQIHLPSCPYDCRVTVSIESPLDVMDATVDDGWLSRRTKHRTSFTRFMHSREPANRSRWQADLTRVEAVDRERGDEAGAPTEAFEVELELGEKECVGWMREEEQAEDATKRIAWDLWERIQLIMPREETAGSLEEVKSAELECEAQRTCLRPFKDNEDRKDFPGTMPVGFSRRSVAAVQQGDYYVSEKTDGVRYLLAVVNGPEGPEAMFLDRRFKAFQMEKIDMKAVGRSLGVGTVLDGEVVRNRSWRRDVFMVFDCLAVEGEGQVEHPFIERLGAIQKKVMTNKYLKYLEKHEPEGVHRKMKMLPIIMKHFYKASMIAEITRHIKGEGADRVYLEMDKSGEPVASRKRHHKSDGLIFAPNLPYVRGTDFNYMKWKWHDTITLDFETRRNRSPHSKLGFDIAFASESDKVDFTEHVVIDTHDCFRLLGDLGGDGRTLITEWEYSPEIGAWKYKMPRPDKKRSNFARTVLSTIMEIAEAMEIEELEYRLTFKNPADDDWDEQMKRKRSEVLHARRSRAAPR